MKFLILLIFGFSLQLNAATYIQGNSWKSSDLSKTWTPMTCSGSSCHVVLSENVSGDATMDSSGVVTLKSYYTQNKKSVVSKTANYTLTLTDDYVNGDATSGAFAFTFPAASTSTNKVLTVKKTDSSFNAITLSGTGMTTNYLMTVGETASFISDGSSWIQVYRKTDTDWIDYTPIFTNLGTVSIDHMKWKRQANGILIRGRFSLGTTAAAVATITIPNSSVWRTTAIPTQTLVGDFVNNNSTSTMKILATNNENEMYVSISSPGFLGAALGTAIGGSGDACAIYTYQISIANFSQ